MSILYLRKKTYSLPLRQTEVTLACVDNLPATLSLYLGPEDQYQPPSSGSH